MDRRFQLDDLYRTLRRDLHRFCTRMTGSPCDGDDVLQASLEIALVRVDDLREDQAMRAWLFRIAHRQCIDFIRARRKNEPLDDELPEEEEPMADRLDDKARLDRALAHIVTELPPKERAVVVLKDLLDCSLEETAEITTSNVGAVKAALHRAREKVKGAETTRHVPMDPERRAIVTRYLDAFNRRDWDGVRALLATDAQLKVVRHTDGLFANSGYFTNYARIPEPWRFAIAWVDGVESLVQFRQSNDGWRPLAIVNLHVVNGRVERVVDYIHVDDLLEFSTVEER